MMRARTRRKTMSSVRNPAAAGKSRLTLAGMTNVVDMNGPARRRRRSSRTALVLGGGGFTGGVYQIGALRALDLLSVNRSVNTFDVYVGTSAGSLIAALVANGVSPEEMMRTVNDQLPHGLPALDRSMLLRLNKSEMALKALKLPLHAVSVARNLVRTFGAVSAVDLVLALGDALPSGIYTGEGVERYLREALAGDGRDRKSTRLNSSHSSISYAVFCLKKKISTTHDQTH